MKDPLVEMMRQVTKWKHDTALDNEAGELSELAYFNLPWFERLAEEQQNQVLLFAYRYAEERLKRILT